MSSQNKKPIPVGILGLLLFVFFVVVLFRLLSPTPVDVVAAPKPVAEEVNTYRMSAYEVARGGVNIILYKAEVGNDIVYFTNQGGVWGHQK